MSKKNSKPLWITAIVLVAIVTFIIYQNRKGQDQTSAAQTVGGQSVIVAYQTGVDPSKVAQANGDYEKDSNEK